VVVAAFVLTLGEGASAWAQPPRVGLSSVRSHRFDRESLPNANSDGGDLFGAAFAAGDFNGDGTSDLAIGASGGDGPAATPVNECGEVHIRYGQSGIGLAHGSPPTVLGQFASGSTDPAEAEDRFGYSLAACDLNGDLRDDLVVGVPLESYQIGMANFVDSGVVEVYYGTSAGLAPPASTRLSEATGGHTPGVGAYFGLALACGDFDADGFDDVAVGLPFRDLPGGTAAAGRVHVFPGSAGGVGSEVVILDQTILGVGDPGEANEWFGFALAAGDFDSDGFADLAIGVPGETVGDDAPGGVQVVYGGASGLPGGGNVIVYQTDLDPTVANATFGISLAVGDFSADGFSDLAVGAHAWDVAGHHDAGIFFALYGTPFGLGDFAFEAFTEDSILTSGASSEAEFFGYAIAAGDFDGDGVDDVAVSAYGEDRPPFVDVGTVGVVMGAAGLGLEPGTSRYWFFTPAQQGMPGDPSEASIQWGIALGTGDFDGNGTSDLVVGAPFESEDGLSDVGTATILYGALFADGFETGDLAFWVD
jgi:hypothetical protein